MHFYRRLFAALTTMLLAPLVLADAAFAQAGVIGAPRPWEMDMQPGFSPVKERIIALHDLVLVIITLITLFVGVLLVWVMVRYNKKANPTPSQLSHHSGLEVAWTVLPILILMVIVLPSFRLVYYEDRTQDADMTVKVTAHQWYWEYTYPDSGNLNFSSYLIPDDQLKPGQRRLLEVDNELVVPEGKNIRLLLNSTEVIHSFFIPSLGVQRYAIPGRTIETWMRVDKAGTFYGECNQICGKDHSRMPIVVHAVSQQEFNAWLITAKTKFSDASPAPGSSAPGSSANTIAVADAEVRH